MWVELTTQHELLESRNEIYFALLEMSHFSLSWSKRASFSKFPWSHSRWGTFKFFVYGARAVHSLFTPFAIVSCRSCSPPSTNLTNWWVWRCVRFPWPMWLVLLEALHTGHSFVFGTAASISLRSHVGPFADQCAIVRFSQEMRRFGLEYYAMNGRRTRVSAKRKHLGRRFRFGSGTRVFNSA